VRGALVAAQIALGIVVLTTSGLLLRSFTALRAVRLGFDSDHVATVWLSLPRARYRRPADVVRFYARLVDRVTALPSVTRVGVTSRLPLSTRGVNQNPFYPEDAPEWRTKLPPLQLFTSVSSDYLATLHIPIIAGRGFEPAAQQREREALISRRTATIFWHDSTGSAALGKRFRALPTDPLYTVVGVVADVHDTSLALAPSPTVYFPELVERVTNTGTRCAHHERSWLDLRRRTARRPRSGSDAPHF
jgi:hypothetical protein